MSESASLQSVRDLPGNPAAVGIAFVLAAVGEDDDDLQPQANVSETALGNQAVMRIACVGALTPSSAAEQNCGPLPM